MQQTLVIALCDTNFADRRQMERLLDRESDKRLDSCVFYMDTYGNKEALLKNPRSYDAYFLDMPDETYSAYDLAKELRAKNIASPIIFCCSTMDYRSCGRGLPNTFFLNKPILTAELSSLLDELIQQKTENYVPSVEVRDTTQVHYLTEKEIVYCINPGRSRFISIHLQDGTVIETENFIDNFLTELTPLGAFFAANKNTLINARYVDRLGLFSVTLKTGETFKLRDSRKKDIEKMMAEISGLV